MSGDKQTNCQVARCWRCRGVGSIGAGEHGAECQTCNGVGYLTPLSPWRDVGNGTTNGVRWCLQRRDSLNAAPSYRVITPMGGEVVVGSCSVSHLDVVIAALSAGSGSR